MKLRRVFFIGVILVIGVSCVRDRECSCSDGNRFEIRAQRRDASQMCEVYSNDSISCNLMD